jgi:hypothetical protein
MLAQFCTPLGLDRRKIRVINWSLKTKIGKGAKWIPLAQEMTSRGFLGTG